MEILTPPLLSKPLFPSPSFATFVSVRRARAGIVYAAAGGRPRRNTLREKLVKETQVSGRGLFLHKYGNLVENLGKNGSLVEDVSRNWNLDEVIEENGSSFSGNERMVVGVGEQAFIFGENVSLEESMEVKGSEFSRNGSLGENEVEHGFNFVTNQGLEEVIEENSGDISLEKNWEEGLDYVQEDDLNEVLKQEKLGERIDEKGREIEARLGELAEKVVNSSVGSSPGRGVPRSVKLNLWGMGWVGVGVLCGWFALWVMKKLVHGKDEQELTEDEKKMLRMKMKMRIEKERESSGVEVLGEETDLLDKKPYVRPHFDRSEIMDVIFRAKEQSGHTTTSSSASNETSLSDTQLRKMQKIQSMARKVREDEKMASLMNESEKAQDGGMTQNFLFGKSSAEKRKTVRSPFENSILNSPLEKKAYSESERVKPSEDNARHQAMPPVIDLTGKLASGADVNIDDGNALVKSGTNDVNFGNEDVDDYNNVPFSLEKEKPHLSRPDLPVASSAEGSSTSTGVSNVSKPRVITSVKEAREYLSQKYETLNGEERTRNLQTVSKEANGSVSVPNVWKLPQLHHNSDNGSDSDSSTLLKGLDSTEKTSDESSMLEQVQDDDIDSIKRNNSTSNLQPSSEGVSKGVDPKSSILSSGELNWIEKNFENFEPIARKIGLGFKENYMIAKEGKSEGGSSLGTEFRELVNGEKDELEWMKDENLCNIVFKVRDNELAGKDPFYDMSADEKRLFFEGLEKNVEKENKKLGTLHKWVHSRVENLDYGSEGISLHDPPEKIIPRWKGEDPETIRNTVKRKSSPSDNTGNSASSDKGMNLQHGASGRSSVITYKGNLQDTESMSSKIVIQSSDGSARVGKKGGKEHWEHTKKWSQEFLQVYNDEIDPEVKSILKDMGTDLDKWITQKEVTEAADIMTRIPKRKRQYIEKKMNKLKEEIELYGQQAVVSKYQEYTDEKEEDYLWWLDLPHILCIELYTNEEGVQKSGFYSLEMAQDLELDPKPCHVVAFENTTDAKNYCYIMQAHLEMLGIGTAYIIARPPKDAFRDAKANGHGITVIRKGQLRLNADQTLEEVESEVEEIGSKMYHDQIMREHSVDVGTIMKGLIRSEKLNK